MTRDSGSPKKLFLVSTQDKQSPGTGTARDFEAARRARDAIAVAVALLDDLFSLPAGASGEALQQDVVSIFQEIEEIARTGAALAAQPNEKGIGL